MTDKFIPKERDVGRIIQYLTNTFNEVISNLDRPARINGKANQSYSLQTEFAYLLNEVAQGPKSILQKNIAACNEFIDQTAQKLG
jgi:hypothetical protein